MRAPIRSWQELSELERRAFTPLLAMTAAAAAERFNEAIDQDARDTLVNMYYLFTSDKVAGDIWSQVSALRWIGRNQLGLIVSDPTRVHAQLAASGNFLADSRLILCLKRAHWSLRQVRVAGQPIFDHGLQIYRPRDRFQPELLVADIDTIVFAALWHFPRHAFDIWRPDPALNDPLRARAALVLRGIFPESDRLC